MNTALQHYLAERPLDAPLVNDLSALPPEAQPIVNEIIDVLRPSANTLRDILRLAGEISRRDGTSWAELFSDAPARSALDRKTNLGAKDCTKALKKFLERKRFPETAAIEAELAACRKQLQREVGLSIDLPEDLEGDSATLTLRFDSPEDLVLLAEKSLALSRHPALERMFQLLKGQA